MDRLAKRLESVLGTTLGTVGLFLLAFLYCTGYSIGIHADLTPYLGLADYTKVAVTWFGKLAPDFLVFAFIVTVAWLWAEKRASRRAPVPIDRSKFNSRVLWTFIFLCLPPPITWLIVHYSSLDLNSVVRQTFFLVMQSSALLALWTTETRPLRIGRAGTLLLFLVPMGISFSLLSGIDDATLDLQSDHFSTISYKETLPIRAHVHFVLDNWIVLREKSTADPVRVRLVSKDIVKAINP